MRRRTAVEPALPLLVRPRRDLVGLSRAELPPLVAHRLLRWWYALAPWPMGTPAWPRRAVPSADLDQGITDLDFPGMSRLLPALPASSGREISGNLAGLDALEHN